MEVPILLGQLFCGGRSCIKDSWFADTPHKLEVGRCHLAQAWKSCHRMLWAREL